MDHVVVFHFRHTLAENIGHQRRRFGTLDLYGGTINLVYLAIPTTVMIDTLQVHADVRICQRKPPFIFLWTEQDRVIQYTALLVAENYILAFLHSAEFRSTCNHIIYELC